MSPSYEINQHEITADSRTRLIELAKIGVAWVAGRARLEDVEKRFGASRLIGPLDDEKTYSFSNSDYGVFFNWNPRLENANQRLGSRTVEIRLQSDTRVKIKGDELMEALGLRPTKAGELIDGVRRESLEHYAFVPIPDANANRVHLNYRLPQADDSDFEVYAGFEYERFPGQLNTAVDNMDSFRQLEVSRQYLTPEELNQRNHAKRQKYGYMDLRTGMLCPETGWWEGWTIHNHVDKAIIRAGQAFPKANLPIGANASQGAWFVDAQWLWHGPYEEEGDT
ncbi:hypothetical protein [Caballeronia sp. GAFFF1]|uniref:hypothetical protein n=1 Tax=Caballeronia sp. GAFFF1 TaxID=2921779 RepID=UPI002028AE9D|nr:hypothetical protein [Caballeronia sp. GAFFF1]